MEALHEGRQEALNESWKEIAKAAVTEALKERALKEDLRDVKKGSLTGILATHRFLKEAKQSQTAKQ